LANGTPTFVEVHGGASIDANGLLVVNNTTGFATFSAMADKGTPGGQVATARVWFTRSIGSGPKTGDGICDIIDNKLYFKKVGRYLIQAHAAACGVGTHQIRIRQQISDTLYTAYFGTCAHAPAVRNSAGTGAEYLESLSHICCVVNVTNTNYPAYLEQIVDAAGNTFDLGRPSNYASGYTEITAQECYVNGIVTPL
jgi:hypothetical protein